MTVRTRSQFPWITLLSLLAACSLVACEDEPPNPAALCTRAASCEPMELLVSVDACTQQVRQRLTNAPAECSDCVLGLPCSGMARVASGKISLAQICPSCPSDVTSRGACSSRHEHVLICGIATRPPPAASASASASASALATAQAAAAAVSSVAAAATTPPALPPLPTVPKLPTVPVPPAPP